MTFTGMLHIAALLLMQGDFPRAGSETITLKEGEDLKLRCTLGSDNSSALQWLNPRGFAIFLNTQQALRDQRYKLIWYSKDELSIRLSNITVHDEGIYKCFYYSIPFKSKNTTVEVLAAPSNPVLEVSQNAESSIILSCYTYGCKPQPQITWLLDNGIELLVTTTQSDLNSSTASAPGYPQHPGSEQPTILSAGPKDPVFTSSVSIPTQQNLHPDVTSAGSEVTSAAAGKEEPAGSSSYLVPNGTKAAFSGNVTQQELPRTEAPSPTENVTVISITTFGQDLKSEGIKEKETKLLLPMLVAALVFVLLIVVLLFMRKLKKAHGVWKRENDVSEQTLESYKSKSNEDSSGHEKNGHVVSPKPNAQYVTEGYVERRQKNPSKENTAIRWHQHMQGALKPKHLGATVVRSPASHKLTAVLLMTWKSSNKGLVKVKRNIES
ncbi:cytotoxic and regulatory T-cell molecule isoform X4 [Cuculus canorus]|uniref:cytotoxic and regulatory T-cell molecule isoform X4 n=1 Tax=Cuculus canorus TaxID=55661 RepID=UPI0023AAD8FC|nr:cytotoxic and regulatory T-cell molecule isoform X4 [Cuculus canorus]